MNLTVEWVHDEQCLVKTDGVVQTRIPVIRVATLRKWLEQSRDGCITLEHLLAQLPEGK